MPSRQLLRLVSATLVAIFAVLASAAAVCLVPCELTPDVHAETTAPQADHCAGAAAADPAGSPMLGADESCGGQHAWISPAADRLASRAYAAAAAAVMTVPDFASNDNATTTHGLTVARPPVSPPTTLAPLRI